MTTVIADVPMSVDQTATDVEGDDHLVCCQLETVGERTLTLCGRSTTYDGVTLPEDHVVACETCNELDRIDYCPLRLSHRCTAWGTSTIYILEGYTGS